MGPIACEIDRRLRERLAPLRLEIIDDSARHRGHAGYNPAGESHFTVRIISSAFDGQSRIARQRAVYAALGDLMQERIHALAIEAKTPGEAGLSS